MAEKQSYVEIIAAGVYLDSLSATRDAIAEDLKNCESMRDKAALYMRLSDVLAKIELIRPVVVRGDAVDEIAARRVNRRKRATADSPRAERQG